MVQISIANTASFATVHNERYWGVPLPEDQILKLEPGARILDVGSGTADSKLLAAVLEVNRDAQPNVFRLDYFEDNVRANPAQGPRIVADATEVPFANGAFDAVVTSEVTPDNPLFDGEMSFHDLMRLTLASEVARVLRVGGTWLGYNESLSMPYDRPPGMVGRFQYASSMELARNRLAYGLSFGTFEKIREPIDPTLIGQNASLRRGTYKDAYLRRLNEQYPVEYVLGKEIVQAARKGNFEPFDASVGHRYDGEYAAVEHDILIDAIKHGQWRAWTIRSPQPNAEAHIRALAGYRGWRVVEDSDNRPLNRKLQVLAIDNPCVYFFGHKDRAVAVPNQWMLDTIIEQRTTQRVELEKGVEAYVPVAEI